MKIAKFYTHHPPFKAGHDAVIGYRFIGDDGEEVARFADADKMAEHYAFLYETLTKLEAKNRADTAEWLEEQLKPGDKP